MNSRNSNQKSEASQICPSSELLRRFVHGTASAEEESLVERHLDQCQHCGQRVDELARDSQPGEELRRALGCKRDPDWDALQAAGIPPLPQGEPQSDAVVLSDGLRLAPPRRPQYMASLGRFDVLEILAQGGMGTVLRAWDDPLHREVALKVISPRWAEDPVARERFLQEARAAASLRHDNIITVYDVDQYHNVPFIVMDLIPGKSLALLIAEEGPLEPPRATRIVHDVLAALEHAHARGIIHRDIKPANVLLETSSERAKLVDFGLSRSVQDAVRHTAAGTTLGTPWYMSPEQVAGLANADARSDVYSTGVLLFELLTGALPFPGRDLQEVFRQIRERPLPELRQFDPAIPEGLARIVCRATEKAPAARFPTAAEFAQALDEFLSGHGTAPGSARNSDLADRRSSQGVPPLGSGAFPRCAVCTEVIISRLSVAGVCPECQAPICSRCFKVRGIRHCPQHEPTTTEPSRPLAAQIPPGPGGARLGKEPPAPQPPVPAALARDEAEQLAATEAFEPPPVAAAVMSPQADSALDQRPAPHDQAQPWAENRDPESASMQPRVAARQAYLAEQTFLRTVENVLQTVSEIRDPLREVDLRVGDWRRIREQTERLSSLRSAPGQIVSADELQASYPRGTTVRYEVRQRNLTGGVRGHVVVEVVNLARVERFVADGCDTEPLTQMELEFFLNAAAVRAAAADAWHLLILASPTGWTAEARDFATGQGPRPFRDRALSVILYEAAEGRFPFDPLDENLRRLRDAFSSDLDEATFQAACDFAREHLMLNESLDLETLVRQLGVGRRVAERIFRLLAASDQFCVVERDETRHQVLVSQQGSPAR